MEATVEVKFQEYQTGLASVLLVNHTASSPVQYVQSYVFIESNRSRSFLDSDGFVHRSRFLLPNT